MPLSGEYAPSTRDWVREQAERYEQTRGAEENTFLDRPIILMTCMGATSGKLRKLPLMRVEHGGSTRPSPPMAANRNIRPGTTTSRPTHT